MPKVLVADDSIAAEVAKSLPDFSQTIAVDWMTPTGRIGGYVERIGRNVGAYWNLADPVATVDALCGQRQLYLIAERPVGASHGRLHGGVEPPAVQAPWPRRARRLPRPSPA